METARVTTDGAPISSMSTQRPADRAAEAEVDGGLGWNVGSQVRPTRHECLQCGRRVIGMGLLLRRVGDEGFQY
jgi:hypothetical protein